MRHIDRLGGYFAAFQPLGWIKRDHARLGSLVLGFESQQTASQKRLRLHIEHTLIQKARLFVTQMKVLLFSNQFCLF